MAKKDVWDVEALMGQTVAITGKDLPVTAGTVVEQDRETITIVTPLKRTVTILKDTITSITQRAVGEI